MQDVRTHGETNRWEGWKSKIDCFDSDFRLLEYLQFHKSAFLTVRYDICLVGCARLSGFQPQAPPTGYIFLLPSGLPCKRPFFKITFRPLAFKYPFFSPWNLSIWFVILYCLENRFKGNSNWEMSFIEHG